jgi:proline dehydrogenase
LAAEKGFLKGLIFRLVRKHIAGGTADSAIRTALKLNEKKIHTSITFLNENPRDSAQVRYNVNAYLQLIRQISRLHAKSDISVRPSQFGYEFGNGTFEKSIEELLEKAKESKINVWVENENGHDANALLGALEAYKSQYLGIEVPLSKVYNKSVCDRCKRAGLQIKISAYEESEKKGPQSGAKSGRNQKQTQKQKQKQKQKQETPMLEDVLPIFRGKKAIVSSYDEKIIYRAIKHGKASKKDIVFETLYGFSPKKVKRLMKDNINVRMYIPYGKDWVPFAIKRLTEGHIRDIAVAVLDGEAKNSDDGDGKGNR